MVRILRMILFGLKDSFGMDKLGGIINEGGYRERR